MQIVNIVLVGRDKDNFVLVDAGMPGSAEKIIAAVGRFGENSRPKAIVLTHGHSDHVGAVIELVKHWNVPVFAHELEFPYLTGQESYPEPDPTVEGGMVAKMSPLFPNEPIDIGSALEILPEKMARFIRCLAFAGFIHQDIRRDMSHFPGRGQGFNCRGRLCHCETGIFV